ncbi:SMP-30/gluconolactonase/LRE family protein [Sphingomonas panacis]|nr:SMP-30/gluconolactonase/LRE family protein [Sphingomonas panacis]
MRQTIKDFKLKSSDVTFFGKNLNRPECVWIDREGIWVSDSRGGIASVHDDDEPMLIGAGIQEVNGFSRRANGNFVVADISGGALYEVAPNGDTHLLLDEIGGAPLGAVNHAWVDHEDRIWVSIMTRHQRWYDMLKSGRRDGYIIRIDERGPVIVADDIACTNEVKVGPDGKYLHAAETLGNKIIRFPIFPDGSLGDRQTVGPESLGYGGWPDGFTFDADGNIWVTLICRNGISVITPDGAANVVCEDVNRLALDSLVASVQDQTTDPQLILACASGFLPLPTSIAFGGPDARTAYVGSIAMPCLAAFPLPTSGQ